MAYTFDRAADEGFLVHQDRVALTLTDGQHLVGEIVGWTRHELVIQRIDGAPDLACPFWSTIEQVRLVPRA